MTYQGTDEELWAKAEKVAYKDYQGRGIYYNEKFYFDDPGGLMADAGGVWPEMVYGTIESPIALDAFRIIDDLEQSEEAYEDYEVSVEGCRAIEEFCERWNRRYADTSYSPDFETGITNADEAGEASWRRENDVQGI